MGSNVPVFYALNKFNESTKILQPDVSVQLSKWSIKKSTQIEYSQYWQHQLPTAVELLMR